MRIATLTAQHSDAAECHSMRIADASANSTSSTSDSAIGSDVLLHADQTDGAVTRVAEAVPAQVSAVPAQVTNRDHGQSQASD
jgi:hypothetical protein